MAQTKAAAYINVQWEEASGGGDGKRMFLYQFEQGSDVKVKQMLDWALKAMKEQQQTPEWGNCCYTKCGMPEFEDAKHGFVGVDAEITQLVNNGVYRVRLHQAEQEKQQPKQQDQNGEQHGDFVVASLPNSTESPVLIDYEELLLLQSSSPIGGSPRIDEVEEPNNNTMLWDDGQPLLAAVDDDALLTHKFDKQLRMSNTTQLGTKVGIGMDQGRGGGGQQQQQNPMLLARREIEDAEHLVLYDIDGTRVNLGQHLDGRKGEFLEDNSDYVLQGQAKLAKFHEINFGTDDHFELLGIGPQQKAQIIAEQCIPSGFAKILTEKTLATGAKTSFSLMEIVSTKTMTLDPFDQMVGKHCLGSELPQNATHLLTFISYGAIMAFVFAVDNPEVDIEEVKKIVNNRWQNRLLPRDTAKWDREVRVKVFAHAMFGLNKEEKGGICFSEALELIGQLPALLDEADHRRGGLGHPLFYSCLPFELLVRPECLTPTNRPPAPISADMANMMAQTRQLFDINQQRLDDLKAEVDQFGYCLSNQMCTEVAKLLEEVQKRRDQMKESWSRALQQQQIAQVLEETKHFFEQLAGCHLLFESIQKKCRSAIWLRSHEVPFVGRGMDLLTVLANSNQQNKCQYVFFHKADCPPCQDTNDCVELFQQLISQGERCIYVDTSLAALPSGIPAGDRIVKQQYSNQSPTLFTHKMSVPKQKALEIFTKTNDGQFEVNEANLAAILLQPEIRGLPVVLINCVGVKRSGKSFLLNFFLLFLQQQQGKRGGGNNPKWLEEAAKAKDGNFPGLDSSQPGGRLPNGFSYRGGIKPETKGILMWSQPFVVETPTGQPVAVVLADSEGSFDWNQSKQHDTLIFSMSVLTSSLLIYNVRNQPDANMLDNLLYFAKYGKMAGSKNATQDMDSKPFQELLFLVRDWPGSGGYGFNGGQPLLEEMLAMESPSNDENQIRGKSIRGLFDRIQCFLMAYPGEKVADDNNQFQGSLNDMSDRFKLHMEELVFDSLSPDHLERAIKCIGNVPVTSELLYHHFVEYGKVFRMSAGTLPNANTFYEASTDVILTQAFDKAKKNYIMKMDRDIRTKYMLFGWNFWDNKKPLSEADLQVIHRGAKLSALKCFDQTRKMGSTQKLKKFREELTSEIEDIFDKKYKRDNDNKRRLKEQKEAYEKQLKEQEERHKKAYEEVVRMAVPKNPLSLGIEVIGGFFSIIMPRDSVLPATYKRHYTTTVDNQTIIPVMVFEGEEEVAAKNYPIGKFEVEVPPLPVGKADVLVTMELQPTGKLNVTAKSSKANEQREYKVREITNKFVVN